ncbi:unnamed protein product [Blepharisma stoltei]|uniref:1-phosphatidylinositol-3-phosphate 5-kinase n=1 Tax=Blepharisma stoltei TaxID=1481888 RepID=A0AAU9JLY1_9CILI|nr:unnamed protein product [Blepharisma stoltei]
MSKELNQVSKEFWMPDTSAKSCARCDKPFTTFRRRHHCRYCGLIFCSKCTSKKSLLSNGVIINRCCPQCLLALKSPNKKTAILPTFATTTDLDPQPSPTGTPKHMEKSESADVIKEAAEDDAMSDLMSLEDEHALDSVKEFLGEIKSDSDPKLDAYANEYFEQLARESIVKQELGREWLGLIIKFSKEIVENLCSSTQFRKDSMDINNYLRIIKVAWPDTSLSEYINGVVFVKNIANKKMNKRIENPKILILKGGTDIYTSDKKLVSMDRLIDQETSLAEIFIRKLEKIRPNVMILEKSLPQNILSEFAKMQITTIMNVKLKIIEQIARATKAKILKSVDQTSTTENYLGTCGVFYLDTLEKQSYVFFKDPLDTTRAGSLILSGTDKFELKKVKEAVKDLVIQYRNIKLELHFFIQSGIRPIPNIFSAFKSSASQFKYLVISNINNSMCTKPTTQNISYYKGEDMTLGDFINSTIKKSNDTCPSGCESNLSDHSTYYIKNGGRIKMYFAKSHQNPSQEIMMKKECKACGKSTIVTTPLSKSAWEYSFYKFINNFFTKTDFLNEKNCPHDFYKLAKFSFHIQGIKIVFEWEENPVYDLIPMSNSKETTRFYANFMRNKFDETRSCAKEVFDDLLRQSKEMILKLSVESIGNESKSQLQGIDIIREELVTIGDTITSSLCKLLDMEVCQFKCHLDIDTYKRSLFLQACSIKVSLEDTASKLKRLKKGSKHINKEPKNPPLSRSSSSGPDNRKSPAQTPTPEGKIYPSLSAISSQDFESLEQTHRNSAISTPIDNFDKDDEFLQSEHFNILQKGNLTLPLGYNDLCVPVEETDSLSIIAYALNSQRYFDEIACNIRKTENSADQIEADLLSGDEKHFKFSVSTYEDEMIGLAHKDGVRRLYGSHMKIQVTAYFPKQFHAIREYSYEPHDEFLISITSSQNSQEQLGKSRAVFRKSLNGKYILKTIDEKEFRMFIDLTPNYFRHVCKNYFHNMPSRLVKTIGAFKISVKNYSTGRNKLEWALLSENLGFAMPSPLYVYDLKGTSNHKRRVKEGDTRTKMDLNFIEDFKGIPITLAPEVKRIFDATIWNDTLFLAKQNVIDYSLLIMVSLEHRKIAAGIIDYMEQYTFEKAIESKYKAVITDQLPTITHPTIYKERYRSQLIESYFMSLED